MSSLKKLLDSDYIKLCMIIFVSFWLYSFFHFHLNLRFIVNRTFRSSSLFLIDNIPFLFFYIIFGFISGVIIKNKILIKSFYAGFILSLFLIFNYIFLNSFVSFLSYLRRTPHILFPSLIFLTGAFIVKVSLRKRDFLIVFKALRQVLTVIVAISFFVLIFVNANGYYRFFSSPAYKNSINFEIQIFPKAQDVKISKSVLRGTRSLSFTVQTRDRSLKIFKYYDDFFVKNGFLREKPFNAGWRDLDTNPIDTTTIQWYSGLYLSVTWLNRGIESRADIIIEQTPGKSENEVIHSVKIYISPFLII